VSSSTISGGRDEEKMNTKNIGSIDHPVDRLPTTINIRYSREEKGKQW